MIELDRYEHGGKTLFIRFKCTRCGLEEFEKLNDCDKRTGDRGPYLHQLMLPKDWFHDDFRGYALCPVCHKDYREFMNGRRLNENPN